MRTLLLTAVLAGSFLQSAAAATVTLPGPLTVLGVDIAETGPSFIVPSALAATDRLSFIIDGYVSLQPGGAFGTNAAGVLVVAGSHPVGTSLPNPSTGDTYGSLLLGNGTTVPYVQLLFPNAATGLGSATPPTNFLFDASIGDIFGGPIAAGTELRFRISDINTGDNGGSFTLTPIGSTVPEPGTWGLALGGLALASTRLVRRRS